MADEQASPQDWTRFRELLDDQNEWPAPYTFKFIAPENQLEALKAVFGKIPVTTRKSRTGKYVSVTARVEVHSSDEVIAIYKAAGTVEGVIAL